MACRSATDGRKGSKMSVCIVGQVRNLRRSLPWVCNDAVSAYAPLPTMVQWSVCGERMVWYKMTFPRSLN